MFLGPEGVADLTVIMTCHNRVELSTRVVRQITRRAPSGLDIRVIAVDDGSVDGTGSRLADLGVNVLRADGNLFWARGMALAQREALRLGTRWVLWINDDLDLAPGSLLTVTEIVRSTDRPRDIVHVGAVIDPVSKRVVYGGRSRRRANPLSFDLVEPAETVDLEPTELESFNGNFVLFPVHLLQLTAFPGDRFEHSYADFLFGLRLWRAGAKIRYLPDAVGWTANNAQTGRMFDPAFPLAERWRFALSKFGIPPRDHLRFSWEIAGLSGLFWFGLSYARVLLPRRSGLKYRSRQ